MVTPLTPHLEPPAELPPGIWGCYGAGGGGDTGRAAGRQLVPGAGADGLVCLSGPLERVMGVWAGGS